MLGSTKNPLKVTGTHTDRDGMERVVVSLNGQQYKLRIGVTDRHHRWNSDETTRWHFLADDGTIIPSNLKEPVILEDGKIHAIIDTVVNFGSLGERGKLLETVYD